MLPAAKGCRSERAVVCVCAVCACARERKRRGREQEWSGWWKGRLRVGGPLCRALMARAWQGAVVGRVAAGRNQEQRGYGLRRESVWWRKADMVVEEGRRRRWW